MKYSNESSDLEYAYSPEAYRSRKGTVFRFESQRDSILWALETSDPFCDACEDSGGHPKSC